MAKASSQKVRVRVPATTSNLGPGFDVLGMALTLYNELTVQRISGPDQVDISGEGKDTLPRTGANILLRAFRSVIPRAQGNFHFQMKNGIPLSRGLGSSAASRLAGLLAAAAMDSRRHDPADIVQRACALEGHPDNVVPAFFGGLCGSIVDRTRVEHFKIRIPTGLRAALCIPDKEVSTPLARRLMPKRVPLADAIFTSSRLALFVAALEQKRLGRLKEAMRDVLHQPYRKRLIPGMDAALTAAGKAGALGAALSGSGPTLFAFTPTDKSAQRVSEAMCRSFSRRGIKSRALSLRIDFSGARVQVTR